MPGPRTLLVLSGVSLSVACRLPELPDGQLDPEADQPLVLLLDGDDVFLDQQLLRLDLQAWQRALALRHALESQGANELVVLPGASLQDLASFFQRFGQAARRGRPDPSLKDLALNKVAVARREIEREGTTTTAPQRGPGERRGLTPRGQWARGCAGGAGLGRPGGPWGCGGVRCGGSWVLRGCGQPLCRGRARRRGGACCGEKQRKNMRCPVSMLRLSPPRLSQRETPPVQVGPFLVSPQSPPPPAAPPPGPPPPPAPGAAPPGAARASPG